MCEQHSPIPWRVTKTTQSKRGARTGTRPNRGHSSDGPGRREAPTSRRHSCPSVHPPERPPLGVAPHGPGPPPGAPHSRAAPRGAAAQSSGRGAGTPAGRTPPPAPLPAVAAGGRRVPPPVSAAARGRGGGGGARFVRRSRLLRRRGQGGPGRADAGLFRPRRSPSPLGLRGPFPAPVGRGRGSPARGGRRRRGCGEPQPGPGLAAARAVPAPPPAPFPGARPHRRPQPPQQQQQLQQQEEEEDEEDNDDGAPGPGRRSPAEPPRGAGPAGRPPGCSMATAAVEPVYGLAEEEVGRVGSGPSPHPWGRVWGSHPHPARAAGEGRGSMRRAPGAAVALPQCLGAVPGDAARPAGSYPYPYPYPYPMPCSTWRVAPLRAPAVSNPHPERRCAAKPRGSAAARGSRAAPRPDSAAAGLKAHEQSVPCVRRER